LGPSTIFEVGYDWRDSLLNSANSFADLVNNTLDTYSTDFRAKAVFVTHSMGGLLTRVAVSRGQISTADIDRIVHIGTPLLGAPSAFSSLYGQLRFPFLGPFLWWTHGKRAVRFRENLFECVRTFKSAWELLPHDPVAYIRHQGTIRHINPLSDKLKIIDPSHVARARQVHQLVVNSESQLVNAGIPVHKIYTSSHQTPTEYQYDVGYSSTAAGDLKYDLVAPPIVNSNGDGTVPNTSAWGTNVNRYPVIDVSHVEMCNHSRVAKVLWGLL
jgi:pimeloyl-ACP methyl ester carboxylesterase